MTEDATSTTNGTDMAHCSENTIRDQLPNLRTALDIQTALNEPGHLPVIGFCPLVDRRSDEDIEYGYHGDTLCGAKHNRAVLEEDLSRVQEFIKIHTLYSRIYCKGYLKTPFKLTISLPGYSFNDVVGKGNDTLDGSILQTWFSHASPSGFGDLRDHVTKFDESVRAAREISWGAFRVEPELIREVEDHWRENFVPTQVRAEPYKIHLYGPGGQFKPHRDTPQKDLVGTFLVGLGDTCRSRGNLVVDGNRSAAYTGNWVAFYPDVAHEVRKLGPEEHRAVIAFKIFRVSSEEETLTADSIPSIIHSSIESLISALEPPFGFILDRKYCLGTTKLSGVDEAILTCAKMRHDISVDLIPVVIQKTKHDNFSSKDRNDRPQIITKVSPFTRDVIEDMLDRKRLRCQGEREDMEDQWDHVRDVVFYDIRGDGSSVRWSYSEEQINYFGNEADATREDSVYLSHALLCLSDGEQDESPDTEMSSQ